MELTIELDPSLATKLTTLAADMGRSADWVIARAIEDYVKSNTWQVAQIKEGIAQADRGEFATDAELDEVLHQLERSLRQPNRR
jgi:predicted transcriptional regulator